MAFFYFPSELTDSSGSYESSSDNEDTNNNGVYKPRRGRQNNNNSNSVATSEKTSTSSATMDPYENLEPQERTISKVSNRMRPQHLCTILK